MSDDGLDLPWYFAINDRPAMAIRTEDGGMDVLRLNVSTGEFERDWEALSIVFEGGRDVDKLTEDEFNALVKQHRDRIASK